MIPTVSRRIRACVTASLAVAAGTTFVTGRAMATTPPAAATATPPSIPCPVVPVTSSGSTAGSAAGSTAGSAPEGSVMAESARAGIRFAVPSDFTTFNPEALQGVDASQLPSAIVDMATNQGMEAGAYLAKLANQTDLLIVGTPVNGFAPNLNVIATSVSALPSASEITSQLVGLGATDVTVTPTTTAVGDAFVTSYAITAGTTTAFGGQIGLTTPTGSALVSVTTSDRATTDALVNAVVSTVTTSGDSATPASADCLAVSSARAGLSFAVPAGYDAQDPAVLAQLDESQLPPEMTDLAATQGMTAKEMLTRTAKQSDLLIVGPLANGVTTNLNVIASVGAMPTADQLSAELQAANIQATITTESSPVGEVLFATYQLTINGAAAEARQFVVNASPNVAVISIIAGDPATADELATLVLASLTKV